MCFKCRKWSSFFAAWGWVSLEGLLYDAFSKIFDRRSGSSRWFGPLDVFSKNLHSKYLRLWSLQNPQSKIHSEESRQFILEDQGMLCVTLPLNESHLPLQLAPPVSKALRTYRALTHFNKRKVEKERWSSKDGSTQGQFTIYPDVLYALVSLKSMCKILFACQHTVLVYMSDIFLTYLTMQLTSCKGALAVRLWPTYCLGAFWRERR